jgi:hypothetical protein
MTNEASYSFTLTPRVFQMVDGAESVRSSNLTSEPAAPKGGDNAYGLHLHARRCAAGRWGPAVCRVCGKAAERVGFCRAPVGAGLGATYGSSHPVLGSVSTKCLETYAMQDNSKTG